MTRKQMQKIENGENKKWECRERKNEASDNHLLWKNCLSITDTYHGLFIQISFIHDDYTYYVDCKVTYFYCHIWIYLSNL